MVHDIIDNSTIRELTIKGKHKIDIDKYITHIDHYTDLLSFESISSNIKFSKSLETNKIKNCLAE